MVDIMVSDFMKGRYNLMKIFVGIDIHEPLVGRKEDRNAFLGVCGEMFHDIS